jgi:hypothetical protein
MSNNFEQFIKEVESDLRHEKFEQLWKKYGKNITMGLVVLVALSGAFNWWQHYQTKQRDIVSQQFLSAQSLMFNKNSGDALAAMEGISKSSHRTYSVLAKFNMATILRQPTGHQNLARAEELYQEIMNDRSAEHLLRELATVWYVGLRLDNLKNETGEEFDKLLKLIATCDKDGDPYRHLALELRGMIELRQKNFPKATETFTKLAQDEKTPKDLRLRAQMVTQNLASQLSSKVN